MLKRICLAAPVMAVALASCAETPMGPTVQILPSPGKDYQTFLQEQQFCKTQAAGAVSGMAESENHRAILGAVVGTALGTGLGAAAGGGAGAGIGAAAGATGSGLGAGLYSRNQQGGIQSQYNNAYAQCMLTYRNVLPGYNNPVAPQQVTVITKERTSHHSSRKQSAGSSNTTTVKTAVTTAATASAPIDLDK